MSYNSTTILKTRLCFIFSISFLLISCREVDIDKKSKTIDKIENFQEVEKNKNPKSIFFSDSLIGIWSENLNNKKADFRITEKFFYDLKYGENNEMKYEIEDNKIKINYPKSKVIGMIKKAEKDSLVIYWTNGNYNTYLRWKE